MSETEMPEIIWATAADGGKWVYSPDEEVAPWAAGKVWVKYRRTNLPQIDDLGPMPFTPAAYDIITERRRQIDEEGFGPDHDKAHTNHELARAATAYVWFAALRDSLREALAMVPPIPIWPENWGTYYWKPTNRRRDLVKAAALIIAEIERLDRIAAMEGKDG